MEIALHDPQLRHRVRNRRRSGEGYYPWTKGTARRPQLQVQILGALRPCSPYAVDRTIDSSVHVGVCFVDKQVVDACLTKPYGRIADLFGSVGENAFVRGPLVVDFGYNIHQGDGSFINYNLAALDVATITIGKDCQIATGVQLLTPTHPLDSTLRRDRFEAAEPIDIGDNVWLGGGVIVCPGVTIGHDSVVGAGSVVTRDIEPFALAVGNPAKVIRTLS